MALWTHCAFRPWPDNSPTVWKLGQVRLKKKSWANCPWANCLWANCPWANSPASPLDTIVRTDRCLELEWLSNHGKMDLLIMQFIQLKSSPELTQRRARLERIQWSEVSLRPASWSLKWGPPETPRTSQHYGIERFKGSPQLGTHYAVRRQDSRCNL